MSFLKFLLLMVMSVNGLSIHRKLYRELEQLLTELEDDETAITSLEHILNRHHRIVENRLYDRFHGHRNSYSDAVQNGVREYLAAERHRAANRKSPHHRQITPRHRPSQRQRPKSPVSGR